MMIEDPSAVRVSAELGAADFLEGVEMGRWRIVRHAFPILDIALTATEPDGGKKKYVMRFELTNYPAQAPMVRIWNAEADAPLPGNLRPKGNPKVELLFQVWGDDTAYRPWDRRTGPHGNNAMNLPHLAWRPGRDLMFVLEDLHGILNLNARTLRHRRAA